jgi:SAM-dependent methyltransferase
LQPGDRFLCAEIMALTIGTEIPACRVCRSPRTAVYSTRLSTPLIRCDACQVVFSLDEPDLTRIEQHYSEDYFSGDVEYANYVGEEASHREQAQVYLRRLRLLGIQAATLFDIGCAAGFFLDEARRAGWTVAGCDVSSAAATHARDVLGLDVTRGDFLQATAHARPFDLVTAFNVLEHLPRPRDVADRLRSLVRPGGHLVIETWDYRSLVARAFGMRWHQWKPPFIPYYFTRRSLESLFPPADWEVIEYAASPKRLSVARGLGVLRAGGVPSPVDRVLARISAGSLGKARVTYRFGDLVILTLRRR